MKRGSKVTQPDTSIRVGIVDDHVIVTSGTAVQLNAMSGIRVVLQACSGEQLLELLKAEPDIPDILLMDIEMDGMNGIETTKVVTELYPTIKIIAFTGRKDDYTIVQMIFAGACTYLSKNITTDKLEEAIRDVYRNGKYKADLYQPHAAHLLKYGKVISNLSFTENEKRFLQLLCDGYMYNQMAEAMKVTVDSVNYYRSCISDKLNTKKQVIMILEALRLGIVTLHKEKRN